MPCNDENCGVGLNKATSLEDILTKIKDFKEKHDSMFGDAPCAWGLIWELEKDIEQALGLSK